MIRLESSYELTEPNHFFVVRSWVYSVESKRLFMRFTKFSSLSCSFYVHTSLEGC